MVKLLAIAEPGIIDDAQARLRGMFPQGVCFAKSKPRYLEIVREGVDKGARSRRWPACWASRAARSWRLATARTTRR